MGKQDDFFRTQVRFPAELHEKLVAAATAQSRSMNAELVARLDSTFVGSAKPSSCAEIQENYARLLKKYEALMSEFAAFVNSDKRLRETLHLLAAKYSDELVNMALSELPDRKIAEIKEALATRDHAQAGMVMEDAIAAFERQLVARGGYRPARGAEDKKRR